jgi:hypothetical protein
MTAKTDHTARLAALKEVKMKALLRVNIIHVYPQTGEVDVEIDNCGVVEGMTVNGSDILRDIPSIVHGSDCDLFNEPAYRPLPCSCRVGFAKVQG